MVAKFFIYIGALFIAGILVWGVVGQVNDQRESERRGVAFVVEAYCEWAANSSDLETPLLLELGTGVENAECACLLETPRWKPFMAVGRCAVAERDGLAAPVNFREANRHHPVHADLVGRYESCVVSVGKDPTMIATLKSATHQISARYSDCEAPAKEAQAEAARVQAENTVRQAMLELEARAAQTVAEYRRMVLSGVPQPFGIDFLDGQGRPIPEATIGRLGDLAVAEQNVVLLLAVEFAMARATSMLLDDAGVLMRVYDASSRAADIANAVGLVEVRRELLEFRSSFDAGQPIGEDQLLSLQIGAQRFSAFSAETRTREASRVYRQQTDADSVLLFALADLIHPRQRPSNTP